MNELKRRAFEEARADTARERRVASGPVPLLSPGLRRVMTSIRSSSPSVPAHSAMA